MKYLLILIALFLIAGCTVIDQPISNCLLGSGNLTDRTKGLADPFTSVHLEFPAEVHVIQGDINKLRFRMEDNIFDDMEIEVIDEILTIRHKEYACYRNKEPIQIFVTMKDIDALAIVGSGNMMGDTRIVSNNLDLDIVGSGAMSLDVKTKNLNSTIEGSGTMDLKGETENQECMIVGSGRIDADALFSQRSKINIVGSGVVDVNAKHLDINIAGSGKVGYVGQPETLYQSIEGSGSLVKN